MKGHVRLAVTRESFTMKRAAFIALVLAVVSNHMPASVAGKPLQGLALPGTSRQTIRTPPAAWSLHRSRPVTDAVGIPNVTASEAIITLTAAGFQPTVLTATFGTDVVWINTTTATHTLVSGEPYRQFLPLVLLAGGAWYADGAATRTGGMGDTGDTGDTGGTGGTLPPVESSLFRVILPPGGVFTFTVFTSGVVPYHLADAPHLHGRVFVPLDLPPDPVVVAPPLDPTASTHLFEATRFLYAGVNPIQTDVVSGTIQELRVGVLRGRVLSRDSRPLPNVTISVLDHPEYGQTLSRADGWFDLAVNGGGPLTLNYVVIGHLAAQRQVDVPWGDYAWLPDVVLTRQDPIVTPIDLSANLPVQVARGSWVSDTAGQRRATLLIPQGTQAYIFDAPGVTRTVPTLHLRFSEYTVGAQGPASMPAELPPTSGYTYAVELGAEEAVAKVGGRDVVFSQPIVFYLENFLGLQDGVPAPMGYYDPDRGGWIPYDSGRIVRITRITAGMADVDVNGDGAPDSGAALADLGITDAERATLATLYAAGQSLWRSRLEHLSTWDANQGTRCKDNDCEYPALPDDLKPEPLDQPDVMCRSIVGCQDQTLAEVIDLVGVPYRMHYQSGRGPPPPRDRISTDHPTQRPHYTGQDARHLEGGEHRRPPGPPPLHRPPQSD